MLKKEALKILFLMLELFSNNIMLSYPMVFTYETIVYVTQH